jgi:hypothetical protein
MILTMAFAILSMEAPSTTKKSETAIARHYVQVQDDTFSVAVDFRN